VDHLYKGAEEAMVLYSDDPRAMYRQFCEIYKKVLASGGLVLNEDGSKVLMIFRRGHWDLPKGKRDKGESKRACAAREVMEETGINEVTIEAKLTKTRHMYSLPSGGKAIKVSHWYLMKSKEVPLIPQTEEDIEKAEWVPISEALSRTPMYRSIEEVLELYLSE
jgi:8-oxo-dGTP pyrophosphatase MutT (NUDIX family)